MQSCIPSCFTFRDRTQGLPLHRCQGAIYNSTKGKLPVQGLIMAGSPAPTGSLGTLVAPLVWVLSAVASGTLSRVPKILPAGPGCAAAWRSARVQHPSGALHKLNCLAEPSRSSLTGGSADARHAAATGPRDPLSFQTDNRTGEPPQTAIIG